MLTEKEYLEWRTNPGTQEVMRGFRAWQAQLKEQWAMGAFNSEEPAVTHAANVEGVSQFKMLQEILDMSYTEYEELVNEK